MRSIAVPLELTVRLMADARLFKLVRSTDVGCLYISGLRYRFF